MAGKRQAGILRAFDDGDIINVGASDGGVIDLLNFHRIISGGSQNPRGILSAMRLIYNGVQVSKYPNSLYLAS